MSFNRKKILLVCKESYSYPLYFLGKKWANNNEVGALFFNPIETVFNKCQLNETTYFQFLESGLFKLFNNNAVANEFMKIDHSKIIDNKYLNYIEKNYTHFKNINLQLMSDQSLTRYYHYRNYIPNCTYNQQLNLLILYYKNINKILDEFSPDVIIDCDIAELGRTVLNEVAYSRNIPYITISYPRYESYKIPSYQLSYGTESYLKSVYDKKLQLSEDKLIDEIKYVENFKSLHKIMSKEQSGGLSGKYLPNSYIQDIKQLISVIHYFYEQDFKSKNLKYKKLCPLLFTNTYEYIKFKIRVMKNNRKYLNKNKLFEKPVKGESYVYMPLHLIPESTTFGLAPFYVNELNIIEAVSKSLPAGWYLYVKEHQAMLGERGIDFYKKINKIPNVRLVQINYYTDPKPWIEYSKGVVTITGSGAYEAALLGRKSLVFGDVPFSVIDGITRVHSFEQLPELISQFTIIDNVKSCAAYIAAIKECGQSVNINGLINDAYKYFVNNISLSESFYNEISSLDTLYNEAFVKYSERKNKLV